MSILILICIKRIRRAEAGLHSNVEASSPLLYEGESSSHVAKSGRRCGLIHCAPFARLTTVLQTPKAEISALHTSHRVEKLVFRFGIFLDLRY